ncbi:hypothetical protein MDA_GLEAN10024392 [Myotis davidii]|uniref:Uncharacterized protein n=1 Tax=Myotis davidii TaxID=225400 RepID=L5LPL8_MYODS|nr:hypothetical protein MDA_GLEAN10024392 [Myotis davidii]
MCTSSKEVPQPPNHAHSKQEAVRTKRSNSTWYTLALGVKHFLLNDLHLTGSWAHSPPEDGATTEKCRLRCPLSHLWLFLTMNARNPCLEPSNLSKGSSLSHQHILDSRAQSSPVPTMPGTTPAPSDRRSPPKVCLRAAGHPMFDARMCASEKRYNGNFD